MTSKNDIGHTIYFYFTCKDQECLCWPWRMNLILLSWTVSWWTHNTKNLFKKENYNIVVAPKFLDSYIKICKQDNSYYKRYARFMLVPSINYYLIIGRCPKVRHQQCFVWTTNFQILRNNKIHQLHKNIPTDPTTTANTRTRITKLQPPSPSTTLSASAVSWNRSHVLCKVNNMLNV